MATDTKQLIADKLFELITHGGPNSVTVKRLVEECGISRQTFYYHFKDLLDVLEWGCEQELERDVRLSLEADTPREAIAIFVNQSVARRNVIKRLLQSSYGMEFFTLMHTSIQGYLWQLFKRSFPNSKLNVSDTEAMLDFCTSGTIGLILQNYSRSDLDVDKLVDQIYRLLSGEMNDELFGRAGTE